MVLAKTSGPDREGGDQPSAPIRMKVADVTVDFAINGLEEIRQAAIARGNTASAVDAIMKMAWFAGLLKDMPGGSPASLPKFDGNYHEAARRISLLLRLGMDKPAKAGKARKSRRTGGAGKAGHARQPSAD